MAQQPLVGRAISLFRLHDHLDTKHSVDSSGRVISPKQRSLPDDTRHLNETDSYDPQQDLYLKSQRASERPQTHTLDRATTWIGSLLQ